MYLTLVLQTGDICWFSFGRDGPPQGPGDPPRDQEPCPGPTEPGITFCSSPPFPCNSEQTPEPPLSPQTGRATLTYLTTIFWDSPAAAAMEEQSLLRGSMSLCSLAAFVFRCRATASGSPTSLSVPSSHHHALVHGCWGTGGPGAWSSDAGSGGRSDAFAGR